MNENKFKMPDRLWEATREAIKETDELGVDRANRRMLDIARYGGPKPSLVGCPWHSRHGTAVPPLCFETGDGRKMPLVTNDRVEIYRLALRCQDARIDTSIRRHYAKARKLADQWRTLADNLDNDGFPDSAQMAKDEAARIDGEIDRAMSLLD